MTKVTVYDKATNERVDVFDITYDKSGFPHFLIFKNNQWLRVSAKHFRPYTTGEIEIPDISDIGVEELIRKGYI